MFHKYVKVNMKDRFGETKSIQYPAYIYGLTKALKIKKEHKWHSLILIAGDVGSGKSTFAKGMAALDCHINGLQINIDDFNWSMDKVIEAMDSPDNVERPIISDEWVQSGGARGFALTNIGNKLKIGFVTKRFKKNTYYLLADEIQEFPEKLVKMADAMIIIKNRGLERGFWDCYTDKTNSYFIWNGLKNMGKSWKSPEIKRIKADAFGRCPDYSDIFVDELEFDKRKMEETRQAEEENSKDKKTVALRNTMLELKKIGLTNVKIAQISEYSTEQVGRILRKTTT